MSARVLQMQRPRSFTSAEAVIEQLSIMIMQDGRPYADIASHCGVSKSTIAKLARRDTRWPRPTTLFPLLSYFKVELRIGR